MRRFVIVLALVAVFLLGAIVVLHAHPEPQVPETQPSQIQPSGESALPSTETTVPETTEPETTAPETTVPEVTESRLQLPGISIEDAILYFNEVCLDAEYSHGGNASLVQKWNIPIEYMLLGSPTEEDRATVERLAQWLNQVEGFPGIHETEDENLCNLRIHFCTATELTEIMGNDYIGSDGAVTFWYDFNAIHDANICVRNDLSQHLRNSVIIEEIYNGLGPVQDTALRPDSIICQEYAEHQWLSPVDELILRLLYHPEIQCGMNAEECEGVIRSLVGSE